MDAVGAFGKQHCMVVSHARGWSTADELMIGHGLWSKVDWASLLVAAFSQKHDSGARSKFGSNPTGALRNLVDSPAGISSGCSPEKEAMLQNGPILLIFCTFSFLSGEMLHKEPFGLVYLMDLQLDAAPISLQMCPRLQTLCTQLPVWETTLRSPGQFGI